MDAHGDGGRRRGGLPLSGAPAMAYPTSDYVSGEWATCHVERLFRTSTDRPSGFAEYSCSSIDPAGQVRAVFRWASGATTYDAWYGADRAGRTVVTSYVWSPGGSYTDYIADVWVEQGPMQLGVPHTSIEAGQTPGPLTVTLPANASGMVTFFDTANVGETGSILGTAPIVGGVATLRDMAPFTSVGSNPLFAYWGGNNGDVKHLSNVVQVQVHAPA